MNKTFKIKCVPPVGNAPSSELSDSTGKSQLCGAQWCKVKYLAVVESLCHWEFWSMPVEDVTFYKTRCHYSSSRRRAVWKHHPGRQTGLSAIQSFLSVMHQCRLTSLQPSLQLFPISKLQQKWHKLCRSACRSTKK